MPLVSKHLAGLFNGVSQQTPSLRLASQAEIQENAFSSLVYGLHKRPPLEHVSSWGNGTITLSDVTFFHKIDRDASEKYIVSKDITSGLRVHSLSGVEFPVVLTGASASYLATGNPRADLRMVTLADYTLIVNRTISVGMTTVTEPVASTTKYAYIFVKKGVAEQKYSVSLGGSLYEFTTDVSTNADSYHTTNIAQQLYTKLVANNDLSVSIVGSTIRVKRNDGTDFDFKCYDSWGDAAIKGIKGTIQSFKDLPPLCFQDARVHVIDESTSGLGSYWVNYSFTDENSTKTTGQWIESREPGIDHAFIPSTMPHKMVRKQSSGYITTANPLGIYFEVSPVDWTERKVGDDTTSPIPSFVGQPISDIFLFRNRLGVISKQSLTLSRAGEFFDFFPTTVMDFLDDDPINVEAPAMDASVLTHALPVNEHLMIFSEKQKFIATSGDQTLSNQTISVTPVMTIPSNPTTVPVRAGQMVFFLSPRGDYQSVREYFVQPDYISNEAPDIASHVPQFIPNVGVASVMEAIPNHEVLFITSPQNPYELYVYKYTWSGNEKVQSSWSKWITNGISILSVLAFDNILYVMMPTGFAKVDLTYNPTVQCLDLGASQYIMKYRFSPVFLRATESGPGELEGTLMYRKLALAVTGKSNINVNITSNIGGESILYNMDTSTVANDAFSVHEFFLRGENLYTNIELTDSSEHLTTIQSASFEMFGNKRSTTMP